jgi:hypothetical protein
VNETIYLVLYVAVRLAIFGLALAAVLRFLGTI